MTLEIKGFWHEEDAPVKDIDFANALAKGLIRFGRFVNAKEIELAGIKPIVLRREVKRVIENLM
jgi:hypothetical protein